MVWHRGLGRYLVAATLARTADAGAPLGLVLLAASADVRGAATGLLVAGLSAPHVLGPLLARRLDAARDGRGVLASAFVAYGVALAVATGLLASGRPGPAAVAVVVAGACGPLLTGGLSSRLGALATTTGTSPRRAEGWDAVTYGLAGSAGPAIVAALSTLSPTLPLLALCAAAVVAAALTLGLPVTARARPSGPAALTVRAAMSVMARTGPLRRTTAVTVGAAVPGGALPLLAVALAVALQAGPGAGAVLAAAFGAGTLAGSLALTAWPLRGEPERLVLRQGAVLAATYAAAAAAPTYAVSMLAFGACGAATAWLFTATLAARSAYAPPGARAQVFVTMAALKVAAASAGTVLAGSLLAGSPPAVGPRVLLGCGAALSAAVLAGCAADRRLSPPARPRRAAARRAAPWSGHPPPPTRPPAAR